MRVLDIGTGRGDVALIAAELVGEDGSVVGVDLAPSAVAAARERVGGASAPQRLVPRRRSGSARLRRALSTPSSAATSSSSSRTRPRRYAGVAANVVPGGVVAFHEIDWTGHRSFPVVELWDRCCRLATEALVAGGADTQIGAKLSADLRGRRARSADAAQVDRRRRRRAERRRRNAARRPPDDAPAGAGRARAGGAGRAGPGVSGRAAATRDRSAQQLRVLLVGRDSLEPDLEAITRDRSVSPGRPDQRPHQHLGPHRGARRRARRMGGRGPTDARHGRRPRHRPRVVRLVRRHLADDDDGDDAAVRGADDADVLAPRSRLADHAVRRRATCSPGRRSASPRTSSVAWLARQPPPSLPGINEARGSPAPRWPQPASTS